MEQSEEGFHPCRVCGYNVRFDVWGGDDNLSFTYDICTCCGSEALVEDFNIDVVRRSRKRWLDSGHPWFDHGMEPEDWNLEEQLAQIPERWR